MKQNHKKRGRVRLKPDNFSYVYTGDGQREMIKKWREGGKQRGGKCRTQ